MKPRELEEAFAEVLNEYFYGIKRESNLPERLTLNRINESDMRPRHNYQRYQLENRMSLQIIYRNMLLGTASKYPYKKVTAFKRLPDKAPKGYMATKILERVVLYRFPGVKLK